MKQGISRSIRRSRNAPVVVVALAVSVTGCYRYQAVSPDSVQVGAEIRARLSLEAAERVADALGSDAPDGRSVEGHITEREPRSFVLLVPTVHNNVTAVRLGQRVRFEYRDIVDLEAKRLDRGRTGALLGAGALLTALIVIRQLTNSGEGLGPDPPGGGPTELVVPAALRLRVPF